MKIGFIGGGAMAEAIVCGITSQNLLPEKNVFVSDHKASRCEYLKNKYITYEISVSSPQEILDLKAETKGMR